MLGVSINDVWSQPSLVGNEAPTKKNSRYTKMVGNTGQGAPSGYHSHPGVNTGVPMGGPKGFSGPGGHDGGYGVQNGRPKIEGPMVTQPSFPVPVTGMVSALPSREGMANNRQIAPHNAHTNHTSEGPRPQTREIPYLRESLTGGNPETSSAGASKMVSACHKEVQVLRAMIAKLNHELKVQKVQAAHHKKYKKKKNMKCLHMILQIGLLLLIVVLLVQVMQKVNRLLNSQIAL